ncbi:hypothetical protein BST30_25690 [Mycobacterium mantenii]|uniref:Uncharacterized protein n=1 Tax=Mycobacterium mantenii TaxID=560555 RepID=A0A1X0F9J1_MYCNT|nr:hypothetical protein BST30_25690 [Mycobacterium mantenii]
MEFLPHNTIAVGDAENDLSLFGIRRIGAAVADAVPSVKEHADLVLDAPRHLRRRNLDPDTRKPGPRLARNEELTWLITVTLKSLNVCSVQRCTCVCAGRQKNVNRNVRPLRKSQNDHTESARRARNRSWGLRLGLRDSVVLESHAQLPTTAGCEASRVSCTLGVL